MNGTSCGLQAPVILQALKVFNESCKLAVTVATPAPTAPAASAKVAGAANPKACLPSARLAHQEAIVPAAIVGTSSTKIVYGLAPTARLAQTDDARSQTGAYARPCTSQNACRAIARAWGMPPVAAKPVGNIV